MTKVASLLAPRCKSARESRDVRCDPLDSGSINSAKERHSTITVEFGCRMLR